MDLFGERVRPAKAQTVVEAVRGRGQILQPEISRNIGVGNCMIDKEKASTGIGQFKGIHWRAFEGYAQCIYVVLTEWVGAHIELGRLRALLAQTKQRSHILRSSLCIRIP